MPDGTSPKDYPPKAAQERDGEESTLAHSTISPLGSGDRFVEEHGEQADDPGGEGPLKKVPEGYEVRGGPRQYMVVLDMMGTIRNDAGIPVVFK